MDRNIKIANIFIFLIFLGNTSAYGDGISKYLRNDDSTRAKLAYHKILRLKKIGDISGARRLAVEMAGTVILPLRCMGKSYDRMFAGYYFPSGEALNFFITDRNCVNWIEIDESGIHVQWQSIRGMRQSPGKVSAQTAFGGTQSKNPIFGKMPSYSGKLAYYEFQAPFRYGVLDSQGRIIEQKTFDYPEAGKLANTYPILNSERN